ncbi:MAG: transporter associated domain-containing protein, partial [Alphaproteobacteria bacterium]
SLEDLLEVIVGEIDDEHDEPEEEMIERINATTFEVNAKIKLTDLEEQTGIHLNNTMVDDIDTLGGFIVHLAGRVPSKFEVIHDQTTGVRFIILSSNPSHIEKVKMTNLPIKKEEE